MFWRFFIFLIVIAAIEFYFLQAVKIVSRDFSAGTRQVVLWTAYVLAGINILIGLISLYSPPPEWNNFCRLVASIGFVLLICKLLGSSFLLIDDLIRFFKWSTSLIMNKFETVPNKGEPISRIKFLSQLALVFTIIPAVSFIYGIVRGAYKFRVHKAKVSSVNLPKAFDGFKIVQISDLHLGSFLDNAPIKHAFDILKQQKPDLILFTGDLVNNIADEAYPFINELKNLKAPYGVYSVTGNHDYGDYVSWNNKTDKQNNFEAFKKVHSDSGWRLLINEHVVIEKNSEKIALIGVENWGGSLRFPRYGKLNEAYKGTEVYPFKILMSHDPSHWDKQVRVEYPDIDLTLSGHTHGMQFGIEIPGIKWSPSKYFYKQWAGLYKQDNQYLYVNRGLGFLGYPGRLGIWPEITVIELSVV